MFKSNKNKVIAIIFFFFILFLLVGIYYLFDRNKKRHNFIYVKPIPDFINTLNPKKTRFRIDYIIAKTIMGQFLRMDSSGEVQPAFIKSWKISDSGKKFIFQVREDVYFHSGKKADIEDLIYSLHFLADKNSLVSWLFNEIEGFDDYINNKNNIITGIVKTGDFEVTIKLNKKSFVFLSALADPKIVVLPNNLNGMEEAKFFQNPDGIGPYKLSKGKFSDPLFEIEAFKKYYGNKPKINTYRLMVMDASRAIDAFKKSHVEDLEGYLLNSDQVNEIQKSSSVYTVSDYSTSLFFFNGNSKSVQDILLRQYISQSIDSKQTAIKCKYQSSVAAGFIPRSILGWYDPKNLTHFNLKIKKYKPDNRRIRILSYGDDFNRCIIDDSVAQLKKSGLNIIHIHETPNNITKLLLSNQWELLFDSISGRGPDPHPLLAYFAPNSPHNLINFNDPEIEKMIDKIKSATVDAIRVQYYRELDQYISFQQYYIIPQFSMMRSCFFNSRVNGNSIPSTTSLTNGFEEIWIE